MIIKPGAGGDSGAREGKNREQQSSGGRPGDLKRPDEMEVADMADTRTPGAERTDEQSSPAPALPHSTGSMALMAGAGVTLLLGLLSFVLGMVVRNAPSAPAALHVVATVAGVLSLVLGLVLQMISATRNERIIIVTGMIAGFVGASLGLAAGGFSG